MPPEKMPDSTGGPAGAGWLAELRTRLRRALERDPDQPLPRTLADDVERCCAALRPADRLSATRWVARLDAPQVQDVDATLPAVLAWRDADRDTARQVLASALASQHDDGWFPAQTRPDLPGNDRYLAWPCLALAARALGELPGDPALDLPVLHRHLTWWSRHWQTAGTAGPGLAPGFSPDQPALSQRALAALLRAELDAFRFLLHQSGLDGGDASELRRASAEWAKARQSGAAETAMSPAERTILSLGAGGPRTMPAEGSALLRALQLLEEDGAPPPAEPGSDSGETGSSCARSAVRVAEACRAQLRRQAQSSGLGAAGWLDRHRVLAAGLLAALVGALVAAVVLSTLSRNTLTDSTVETRAGLAARLYAEGRYDESIALYETLQRSGAGHARVEVPLANALFRAGRYGEALSGYRRARELDPQAPAPALNLALTLHRLGRDAEALQQYRLFQSQFGSAFPELAERARTAQAILEERAP